MDNHQQQQTNMINLTGIAGNLIDTTIKDYPLIITIPQSEGAYKTILTIDHDNKITLTGTKEEFLSVLNDPKYKYSGLYIIRPIVVLAVEILRLRDITTSERTQQ